MILPLPGSTPPRLAAWAYRTSRLTSARHRRTSRRQSIATASAWASTPQTWTSTIESLSWRCRCESLLSSAAGDVSAEATLSTVTPVAPDSSKSWEQRRWPSGVEFRSRNWPTSWFSWDQLSSEQYFRPLRFIHMMCIWRMQLWQTVAVMQR